MSYHELSRRELQTMCKEYGLPANKSNAVLASSLTSFLGDPRTNILARAPQGFTLPPAKKSIKARVLPKTEGPETFLASFILEATDTTAKSCANVGHGKILKKRREQILPAEGRKPEVNLSAFIDSSHADLTPQPKTGPLLRRRKNCDATRSSTVVISAADPTENLSLFHEEISIQASGTVTVKKLSTPEPQLVPVLDAAVLDTCNEGCQNKRCKQFVQTSLSPLFRITANVDKLISRATTMSRKFDEWKDATSLQGWQGP